MITKETGFAMCARTGRPGGHVVAPACARGGTVVVLLLAGISLASTSATADPGPGCADITNPTHDGALAMEGLGEQLMAHALDFAKRPSLDGSPTMAQSVATAAHVVRCSEGKLSTKELSAAKAFEAHAESWAASIADAESAERTFRNDVLKPLCVDTRWIANARACIAREKANPSGVVDLAKLHDCGDTIQQLQPVIDKLRAIYQATRRHPYTDCQSEAACTANGWGSTDAE